MKTLWTRLDSKELEVSALRRVDILAEELSTAPPAHPRHALLLGAGASVTSGIHHAGTLIKKWREIFYKDRQGLDVQEDLSEGRQKAMARWYGEPTLFTPSEDRSASRPVFS
jgi:hypothetical protein